MRKSVAIIAAASMLAASLAGCGGSTSATTAAATAAAATQAAGETTAAAGTQAAGETTAAAGGSGSADMVMTWWGNQVRNERTQAAIDLYTQKNPGIKIDGQFSEWADYWDKLATSAAGNAMPDIIQMDYKYLDQYVANNLLLDLSPYVKDGTLNLDDCDPNLVNAGKVGDGLYAICIGINSPALLYNKTVTDQAGVTIKDNMTWDEFLTACKTIYEKTGYKTNVAYNNGENFIEYYLRSNGVVMFQDGKLGGTADDYTEYLKIYEDGIKAGYIVDPSIFAERTLGSVEQDPLVYGSSPDTMSWCGFAYTNQLIATRKAAPEGADIEMTTWPAKDPAKSDYLKPGQFISVAAGSKNAEEAVKFVNWFTNDVDCNNKLLAERGIPLSKKVATAIEPNLDDATKEVSTFLNNVVAKASSQINPPAADGSSEVNDLLNKLEEQVCYGQMTAADAGNQLFTQGNQIMASKKK